MLIYQKTCGIHDCHTVIPHDAEKREEWMLVDGRGMIGEHLVDVQVYVCPAHSKAIKGISFLPGEWGVTLEPTRRKDVYDPYLYRAVHPGASVETVEDPTPA